MNPRIQELVSQAKPLDENGQKVRGLNSEFHDQWMEKFAELIVEECRYVMDCNKGSDQHTEWNRALSETSNKIREHFGVEQ